MNYSKLKKPVDQALFLHLLESHLQKASASEKSFVNYVFKFLLNRPYIYVSNAYIACALGISLRTVQRCFKKFHYLFLREDRYKVKNGMRRQLSCRTALRSFIKRIEILRYLARFIHAIRQFPYLLMTGVVSASLLLSNIRGLNLDSSLLANRLSPLLNNSEAYFIQKRQAYRDSFKILQLSTKRIQGESAERGVKQNFTNINCAKNVQFPKKGESVMIELPKDVVFNHEQRVQWLATPEDVQKAALQRLQYAASQKQITNKARYLLAAAAGILQQKPQKQEPVRKAQAYAPSIEQRAQAEAEYNTLERLQDKLRGRRFFLQRSTTTGAERAALEETAVVLERAVELRKAMQLEADKPKEQQQKATPEQIDIAKYLATLMPENIKKELILAKADGHELTKNNPVLDYILADYLRQNQARAAEGA